ncbi:MAG: DUF1810 domain-containing protein [Ideonella sp.]|nr:DUF1810 domain-containing protein [Ideonella sp.]MBL0150360.1 DUF1810 domain-containing protein [Ideonella sp.]
MFARISPRLDRFIEAQLPVFDQVCSELAAGRKQSHWMWFVFPQIKGLGASPTARHFAIDSTAEALDYWLHPVLGPRLKQCAQLVLNTSGKSAHDIFGSPDDLKLHSCMTLFAAVASDEPVFEQVLNQFYDGQPDARTLELLRE